MNSYQTILLPNNEGKIIPILHIEIENRSEQLPKPFYEAIITLIPKKKVKTL